MPDIWKEISARKVEERESRIPNEWRLISPPMPIADGLLHIPKQSGILTADELHITEDHDATALIALLARGTLTSEAVTLAFCKRAAIAQQASNCLTEIFFDVALDRARQLDAHLKRTGRPLGPLHGLPISLKDSFKIRGYDASVGVANLCFKPATANSPLVDLLLSLGAVLYCKTNVPQSMMALDSHNNVFGRTLNPANVKLTAGGSTGGEAALIAMRGSVLGVGTDVGGSIRIPAACNGLYGLKPSHGRVPFAGQEGGSRAGLSKIGIEATAGPLATSVRDCELFLKVVSDNISSVNDPDVLPQTWSQQSSVTVTPRRCLRIGVIHTDGHVTPLPPVSAVINEVARRLSASTADFEVISIDAAPILSRILKVFNGIVSIDGANSWFDHFDATGEPLSPWLQGRLTRRKQKTTDEVWDLQGQKAALQTAFLSLWNRPEGQIDAMICPVAPHPIAPIDRWNTANYTGAFNLLDLPGGILPVREFVDADLRGELPPSEPLNGWDKINRGMWPADVQQRRVYLGSILSVQILTPRLTERRLVEVMARIDRVLRSGDAQAGKSRL